MPDPGALTIFAEIAIALAGFASLVSVVGARAGGDPPMLDANRLRNLVDTSLLVVVFSLAPLVVAAQGHVGDGMWRGLSAVYGACLVGWGPVAVRRQRRLKAAGLAVRRGWALTLWTVYAAGVAALVIGALGHHPERAWGHYVLGLMLNLVGGCLIFMLVIQSILIPLLLEGREPGPEGRPPAG